MTARTAEFHRGRVHGCCQQPTMEHMTTCHHCGVRGEVMHDAGVGEPVCKKCGDSLTTDKLKPWRES